MGKSALTSSATAEFWECFSALPHQVQQAARRKYALWRENPSHPSLHFKALQEPLWSIRISIAYRALGLREANHITWFWIGTHAEYDRLIA